MKYTMKNDYKENVNLTVIIVNLILMYSKFAMVRAQLELRAAHR